MARERRKKKTDDGGGGGAGWITTFSDLMSLLLTFFILLFSMSTISEEKFTSASNSLHNSLVGGGGGSILEGGIGVGIGEGDGDGEGEGEGDGDGDGELEGLEEGEVTIPKEVEKMYKEAMKIIEAEGISDEIAVSSDQDGVYLDIQESILFGSGDAKISEIGRSTLDSLVDILELTNNDIIVEGFTDDVPMNSAKYSSNWELSSGRAMAVVRYLAEDKKIDPSRLSGRGYGEFSPVVKNDSPENRAKNRRVNIVLVYKPEKEER